MGNQNTSGIVEEKATTSEAPEIGRVSSARDQEEEVENQRMIGDGEGEERIDFFQEKAAEADSHQDPEAAETGPLQTLTSQEVLEEHEGSVNEDPETHSNDITNGSINHVEPKEKCFEEEISELNDEMQDQPCTLREEMQTSEVANSTPKYTSEITNPDSPSLLESADIPSEPQEDHDTLEMIKSPLLADEKPTVNELVNGGERRSCADQDTDHSSMIKSDDTDNEVEIGSKHCSDKVGLPDEEAPQEEEHISSDETILENVVITTTQRQRNEYPTSDVDSSHSSDKIGLPDEKAPQEDQHILPDETILENAVITTTTKQGNEYPTSDIYEKLGVGSSVPSHKGSQVELRKFPSFDFGLERTEESDHTPLLYNDNSGATARSFSSGSSSSALRFQNRSVQIEHYEAVEAKEKTIRMERSNSESSTMADLSLNQPNNSYVSDLEKGIGLEGSPLSTKGSGKRKPKSSSSLFTTCLCCTAVIN